MTTYVISRHAGALAWIKANSIAYDVHLEHLDTIESLITGDVVIGSLPIHMVSELCNRGICYQHLILDIPAKWRGKELTLEQMDKITKIEQFFVKKISNSHLL